MPLQRRKIRDAHQCVQQSNRAHRPWATSPPACPSSRTTAATGAPHKRRSMHQIAPGGVITDAQRRADLRCVPNLPVIMREHCPEPVQRGGRHLNAPTSAVPLQKRLDKSSRHLKLPGSSSARNDLGNPPRTHNSPCRSTPVSAIETPFMFTKCTRPASVSEDCFARSGDALPSNRNRRWRRLTIRQHPQQRQQVGPLMNLIQHHQPPRRFQHRLRLRQPGQIPWTLQVVVTPLLLLAQLPGQRRLAALARSQDQSDRAVLQPGGDFFQKLGRAIA